MDGAGTDAAGMDGPGPRGPGPTRDPSPASPAALLLRANALLDAKRPGDAITSAKPPAPADRLIFPPLCSRSVRPPIFPDASPLRSSPLCSQYFTIGLP